MNPITQSSSSGRGPISPSERQEHVRSVALDLILTILTVGLFNIYIQY